MFATALDQAVVQVVQGTRLKFNQALIYQCWKKERSIERDWIAHMHDGVSCPRTVIPIINALFEERPRARLAPSTLQTLGGRLQDLYQPSQPDAASEYLATLLQQLIEVLPGGHPDE